MIKYSLIITFGILLVACGEGDQSSSNNRLIDAVKYSAGKSIYSNTCVVCHQSNGEGVEGAFPPLANSDYLMADKNRAIRIAAKGMDGEITVNGVVYNGVMASQSLSNKEVKEVMNYVLNSWGNEGGEVTIEEVEVALAGK